MTLHDVLRDLIDGPPAVLNSVRWRAEALKAIDDHEAAARPAAPAVSAPAAAAPKEAAT